MANAPWTKEWKELRQKTLDDLKAFEDKHGVIIVIEKGAAPEPSMIVVKSNPEQIARWRDAAKPH